MVEDPGIDTLSSMNDTVMLNVGGLDDFQFEFGYGGEGLYNPNEEPPIMNDTQLFSRPDLNFSNIPSVLDFDLPATRKEIGMQQAYPELQTLPVESPPSLIGSTESREQSIDLNLLDLSERLVKIKSTIPPLSLHRLRREHVDSMLDTDSANLLQPISGVDESTYVFSMDGAFQLTQELIDFYTRLTTAVMSGSFVRNTPMDTITNNDLIPCAVDQATLLLLLSCHHRVLQMWHSTFDHTEEMVKYDIFKIPGWAPSKKCSQLKIGSFAPSSFSGLMSTVMLLITDLAVALKQALNTLIENIRKDLIDSHDIPSIEDSMSFEASTNNESFLVLTIPACEATLAQSSALIERSSRVSQSLVGAGLLK